MRNRRKLAIAATLFVIPTLLLAKAEFLDTFLSHYKVSDSSKLADKSCGICHVSDEDYRFNPYGKLLAHELLNSGSKELTEAMISSVESKDADGDGFSNIEEIKAGTLPGDKADKPAGAPKPKPTATTPQKDTKPTTKPPVANTLKTDNNKPPTKTSTESTSTSTDAATSETAEHPESTEAAEAEGGHDENGEETATMPQEQKPKPFIPKNGFHPAIVHFPIALFIAGLVLDLLGLISRKRELLLAGWYNLVLAAVTSIAGILTGYLALVLTKAPFKGVIQQHFLLAVVAGFIMWIMVALRVHRHEEMNVPMRALYWLLALAGFVLISWAGHLGGVYVYGE